MLLQLHSRQLNIANKITSLDKNHCSHLLQVELPTSPSVYNIGKITANKSRQNLNIFKDASGNWGLE